VAFGHDLALSSLETLATVRTWTCNFPLMGAWMHGCRNGQEVAGEMVLKNSLVL
jgi:hypothetical protein